MSIGPRLDESKFFLVIVAVKATKPHKICETANDKQKENSFKCLNGADIRKD